MIGQLLNKRYKILQALSSGGFGQTYIAEDTHIPGNPQCVVKQLKPVTNSPTALETARRLFQSEAKSLAKLGDNNQIPGILAFFEENQEFYLVQDFINGNTLSKELTPGKRLSEYYVIGLLKGLLPVLEFIHQYGVIHRDIKPANIIRRKTDGKLVLIDFGAVKEILSPLTATAQSQQGSDTVSIGTPGYMPPEQAAGKSRPNSDIYALGMIGIQALTGVYPGDLGEDRDTGEKLWQHYVSVSPGLAEVLTKMTRDHFSNRYQSATEVFSTLKQLTEYPPTEHATVPTNSVNELTLEWVEAGRVKTQIIRERQPSKNLGTVRIGRDPQQCDIVLSHPTVSGLHAEIYFNPQQQSFYLRSLRQNNPPIVNGRSFPTGEVMLNQGTSLRLGQQDLRVSAVTLKQYPIGYTPTEYTLVPSNTPPQPVEPTVQPTKGEDIELTLEITSQEASLGTSKEITFSRTTYINGNPSQETKKLIVNIPAYSQDGTRLQFLEQGNEGLYGGEAGNVYVRLVVNREVQPPELTQPPEPPQPAKRKFPVWLARGLVTGSVLLTAAVVGAKWRSSTGSDPVTQPGGQQCVVVTGRNLNVRTAPSDSKDNLTGKLVQVGTNVTTTGQEQNGWIHISSPIEGWIWKKNTTSDCSQALSPNPDVIQSTSNSKSASETDNSANRQSVPSQSNQNNTNSYQKGLEVGRAKGLEHGKADGASSDGLHIDASCNAPVAKNEVTGDPQYIQGFKEGCAAAYIEAHGEASQARRNQETTSTDDNDTSIPPLPEGGCPPRYYEGRGGCYPTN